MVKRSKVEWRRGKTRCARLYWPGQTCGADGFRFTGGPTVVLRRKLALPISSEFKVVIHSTVYITQSPDDSSLLVDSELVIR